MKTHNKMRFKKISSNYFSIFIKAKEFQVIINDDQIIYQESPIKLRLFFCLFVINQVVLLNLIARNYQSIH